MATAKKRAQKPKAGHGKGTRRAGGKKAAAPAPSSTKPRGRKSDIRLSPLDRVNRARRIAAARAKKRPDSWPTIAKAEGMSERQVRRVYDDYLTWQGIEQSPDKLVDHTLETIEAAMLELDDTILAAAKDGNHNARVGAVRLLLDALSGRWDVMAASGRLPRSMARWRDTQESTAIFEAMLRVLRERNVGQEIIDELLRAVDEARPRELPAGDVDGTAVPA